jgi:hypothetical protein
VADGLIDALNELSDAALEAEKLGIALKEVRERRILWKEPWAG